MLDALSSKAHTFYIERDKHDPKKDKYRHIEEPKYPMKKVHKRIKKILFRIQIPDYIFSPKKGCSTRHNALYHQDSLHLYKLDIKRYFPSTPKHHVYHFFHEEMQCPSDISAKLAEISTFNGHLPTGSPLSCIMSYYANLKMWDKIYSLVSEYGCKLSVWIDDICISGDIVPDRLIWEVKKVINNSGFEYHKEERYKVNEPKNITGIIVTDSRIMARKGQHRKLYELRKQLSLAQSPITCLKMKSQVDGLSKYIKEIEAR